MRSTFLKTKRAVTSIFLLITGLFISTIAQESLDLESGFKNPPRQAFPRTWWHWTRGNISKDGIIKDLEWMKRVGIGGFQLADVNFGSGQTVEEKIQFASSEWLDMVRYTAEEAERLDLEMAIFSSAGWSLAGGPWVKPEQAMKKLVWRDTIVRGPQNFSAKLHSPPKVNGLIRNMTRGSQPSDDPEYYADYAVIAYPTPPAEITFKDIIPEIIVNGRIIYGHALLDDDLNNKINLPVDHASGKIIVEYRYPFPVTVRAASIASRAGIPQGKLSASEDGVNYRILTSLPGPELYRAGKVRTYAFPEQKAQYFRLEISGAPASPAQVMSQPPPAEMSDSLELSEFKLHSGARVHRWEDKAGFSFLFDYSSVKSPMVSDAINPKEIIELTPQMDGNGHLRWSVPEGYWTIMRSGYSLTGAKNRPAVTAGLGYEVDKLSKKHVLAYIQNYLAPLKEELGDLFGNRMNYLLLDSWEAGMQNWTEEMPEEFQSRRGYDILPYLPVLSGRIVGNADISDRFLWDFRRTLADMFAENFYAVLTSYLHEEGLQTYSEASGVSLEILEDALLCKKFVDIPMGEFWVRDLHPSAMYYEDVRGAASAAHGYGKVIVAAEAFTGGNFETPETLKRISDYWFTQGVNRLVFHTSAHQPLDTKPGNAMVGTHLHRNITWAEQAAPFMTYVARNSFLLQQGKFVADITYLLKEGAPSTMPFWGAGLQPPPPQGYNYDYINTDILLNRMTVDPQGRIILPDGISYRVLVLPQSNTMSLKVLRKIFNLVREGAIIVGPAPLSTPGLEGFRDSIQSFSRLKNILWGDLDGISRTKRYIGKGQIIWGEQLKDILKENGFSPDVQHSHNLHTQISWIHRSAKDTELYFISNQTNNPDTLNFSFRINNKQAEIWHPDDGRIELASSKFDENRTIVPLILDPYEAVFVVFRQGTNPEKQIDKYRQVNAIEIEGAWKIQFPEGWGAPVQVVFDKLISWTKSGEPGVKFFSGTASYHKQISISEKLLAENNFFSLDLGQVKDVAEVFINGKQAGILWKQPYQIEIGPMLIPGKNNLKIDITNQWTNRLAGDQELPENQKILNSSIRKFRSDWETETSGLLGPVKLLYSKDTK